MGDPTGSPILDAALQEMSNWARERDANLDLHVKVSIDDPLFHYTGSDVASIILGTSLLRLTDFRDLKKWDKVEIEYGMMLARKMLQRIGDRVRENNWRAQTVRFFCVQSASWMTAKSMSKVFRFFIGCFTRHIDSAKHWKSFGRDGTGTAIGLRPAYFHPRVQRRPKDPTRIVFAQPIVYNRAQAIRRQRQVIEKTLQVISRPEILAELNLFSRPGFLQAMAVHMAVPLLSNAICTKRPHYADEREIRIFVIGDKKLLSPHERREGSRRFISTKLPLRSSLHKVIVGYHASPVALQRAKRLLARLGYPATLVRRSPIKVI
ncbi:MAG: DUF2971 domain-containing protein [Alphaproteobacteria bacterium]|nr:DUF2971 domain-containing protein [Alphaproteobacteria bacterium]MCW5744298.1 DUF2971 domain-containing protein [Alphaproteobacteria bacterium]